MHVSAPGTTAASGLLTSPLASTCTGRGPRAGLKLVSGSKSVVPAYTSSGGGSAASSAPMPCRRTKRASSEICTAVRCSGALARICAIVSGSVVALTGGGALVTESRSRPIRCARPWSCSSTNVTSAPPEVSSGSASSNTA